MGFDQLSFACIDCGGRHDAQGGCTSCSAAGPLMDLRDPSVRAELVREDEERKNKRRYQMIWAALPVSALVILIFGFGFYGIAGGAAAGYGTSLLLVKLFPARQNFPYLR